MKAEYLEAIETKLAWLRRIEQGGMNWPDADYYALKGEGREVIRAASLREALLYGAILKYGEVVYVGPQFCDMLIDIAPTMPDLTLHRQWLPARSAFIYFAKDLLLPTLAVADAKHDIRFLIKAMGYISGKAGAQNDDLHAYQQLDAEVGPEEVNAIWAATLETNSIVDGQKVAWTKPGEFYPLSFFSWRMGQPLSVRIAEYEKKAAESHGQYANTERHEIRYLCALLQLLDQKLLVAPRTRLQYDRPARRRAEREGWALDEQIRVVTLRRIMQAPTSGEGRPVDWRHRWWVGGHWRQQWYPSLEAHKNIYIAPYIKGPQDKPFKEVGRMFAAVR